MQTDSDQSLLREYAANRSDAAFEEIVRRYADLVYSAALRQMGDADKARDVAQTVFVDLARKAGAVRPDTLLAGWLFRGVRLAALEQIRTDQRRQQRERRAMEDFDMQPDATADWTAVRPVLDEALASLPDADRDALLLRFFKNHNFVLVGAALGVSEDAAQKRVSRALGKLREFLAGRGITTTATALSTALTTYAVQAAPAGFVRAAVAAALAQAPATAASAGGFLKLLTIANMKTTLIMLGLAGGLAGMTLLQANTQRQLKEARTLAQTQATELDSLRAATQQIEGLTNELRQLRSDATDVFRLRAQVAELRRSQAELAAKAASKSRTSESQETTKPATPETPQIEIDAKFVVFPDRYLNSLVSGLASQGGSAPLSLSEADFKGLQIALKEDTNNVVIRGAPRVLTRDGIEAVLFQGETVPIGPDNVQTNIGITLHVRPHYTTNSPLVQLDVTTQMNELASGPGGENQVLSTEISSSMSVLANQTVIMKERVPASGQGNGAQDSTSEPKSLLVFITPILNPEAHFAERLQRVVKSNP